jgi:hypothetical protein
MQGKRACYKDDFICYQIAISQAEVILLLYNFRTIIELIYIIHRREESKGRLYIGLKQSL